VPGVLVLSEFAGAAQSLGAGAILVNPWNITDMAAAIEDALTMSEQVTATLQQQKTRKEFRICTQSWSITDMADAIEDALTMSEQVLLAVTNPSSTCQTQQHRCRISGNSVGRL
jgi:trehalose-6-phosphate synthase